MNNTISTISPLPEARITSLEIAELAGKLHKDVLRSVKKMEDAWEKTCGRKFALTSTKVKQPNGGYRNIPCYSFNQLEFLYVISKYSDEVRARLVQRWYELENAIRGERDKMLPVLIDKVGMLEADVKNLTTQRKELEMELSDLTPKADYYDEVMESIDSFTVRKIAAQLRMTAQELNRILCAERIQYGKCGSYLPYADYSRRGFCKSRTYKRHDDDGTVRTEHRTTWTEAGIAFITELVNGLRAATAHQPKLVQLSLVFTN